MQEQTSETLRAWFRQAQPLCAELFNAAHLMCGNSALAESALTAALLDVWLQSTAGGMGFRERLRASLRREAFDAAVSEEGREAEFTWPGLGAPRDDAPALALLGQETIAVQRLTLLRHGCGLSPRAIARLTGTSASQVRLELERFEARCRRRLPQKARVETVVAREARRYLARRTPDAPQSHQIYRAFEAEADGVRTPDRRLARALGGVLVFLLALLSAGAFWLFAILVRPV